MNKLSDISVRYLKGIGPKKAQFFSKIEINSLDDLLYSFPRRYEDRTNFIPISDISVGQSYTIKAKIAAIRGRKSFYGRGFNIVEVVITDNSAKLSCVWFNQPYLKHYFKIGQDIIVYGRIDHYANRLQLNSPEFEIVDEQEEESLNLGRIVPIYSLPQGITQRYMRKIIKVALENYTTSIIDFIPFSIRNTHNLLNLAKSLSNIHFPESYSLQKEAYRRLAFEEFLLFQLPIMLRKLHKNKKSGITHQVKGELTDTFINNLPFELTDAQNKALSEINSDLSSSRPMQRLLQGDVGSGKTIVATIALLAAIQGGFQGVLMVPTEILARQHYEKICSMLSKITPGIKVSVGLIAGEMNEADKYKIIRQIKDGTTQLIIGTHALLQEQVKFKKLGLLIIDEQHKFGVSQRALLPQKNQNPDVLIMTATPIPRTLAITLYGDLDISVINQLPPGRKPVETLYFTKQDVNKSYEIAKLHLQQGNQIYIIYPVIESSYAMDIAGAKKMYEELKNSVFCKFKLGLIHGKLKTEQQNRVMQEFKKGKINILISTTILEVGIDIPTTTCMIIENAERFGLSQLHQLRGRIGRGVQKSVCILVADTKTAESAARIQAMTSYSDGFKIAEEDLKIRGPGEFFGNRQHGLTELKIADPLAQMHLLKSAREEITRILQHDPGLSQHENLPLKERLLKKFPEYEEVVITA